MLIDGFHLDLVRTGHHSGFNALFAQILDIILEASNICIVHLFLEFVQTRGDELLFFRQRTGKPGIINLHQRLTFYLVLQSRVLRMKLATLLPPKHRVLWFGIEHDPVEVEQCSFHLHLFHLGCKVTNNS